MANNLLTRLLGTESILGSDPGLTLQRVGSGFAGRLGQFDAQRARTQLLKQQEQRTQMDARRKAMAADFQQTLRLLNEGKPDVALNFLDQRLNLIDELGGDGQHTEQLRRMIVSGDVDAAKDQLGIVVNKAISTGLIDAPAVDKVVGREGGTVFLQDPSTGDIRSEQVTDFEDLPGDKEVQRGVPLAGGGMRVLFKDGTTRLVMPTDADRATIEAAEQREATLKGEAEAQKVEGRGGATRGQEAINLGVDAALGIPILRRSLSLLDTIKTGGIDAARLRARQLLGVEGADEGELSANLGRAVLSQLKATFGAQFTEREGARLDRISARFGASPKTNRRLLRQTLTIAQRAADRALAQPGIDKASKRFLEDTLDGDLDLTDKDLQEIFITPGQEAGTVPGAPAAVPNQTGATAIPNVAPNVGAPPTTAERRGAIIERARRNSR